MNEFKRCMRVFSHSPFKVRLMLLSMLCDMVNNKPQKICSSVVDLNSSSLYLLAALRILRLADADPFPLFTHSCRY